MPAEPEGPAATERRVDRLRRRREERRERLRPHVHLLPLAGIIPSFLLATWSLTQPWGHAHVVILLGISRSPSAALLVSVTIAGLVAASVTVATRARGFMVPGVTHFLTGVGMAVVSYLSFDLVRRSSHSLLGVIPLTSVKASRGLKLFLLASVLVMVLGIVELLVARLGRGRPAGPPGRATSSSTSGAGAGAAQE